MTPPAPITGSAKKAATVSGPSAADQGLELGREPVMNCVLALARQALAVEARAA